MIKLLPALGLLFPLLLFAQKNRIQNGPMVGHVSSREAHIWIQTKDACEVGVIYWDNESQEDTFYSAMNLTHHIDAYTTTILLDKIRPGRTYHYQVLINRTIIGLDRKCQFSSPLILKQGEELPEFKLAFGSCNYINDPTTDVDKKGGDYHIFESIAKERPDMMFWLGDNIYLRPGEWDSNTGFAYRYTHSRNIPEMEELLASVIHYATWDDHDYGPNDSDRSYIHKDMAREWFMRFWANPNYGLTGYGLPGPSGITTSFTWGDVDFFFLDNRYFRSPQKRKSGDKTVLGKEQLNWLIDALVFSEANVKVVVLGSLFLSNMSHHKNQNYISNYAEERAYLLSKIEEENLQNILFLTGDKHFSEISHFVNARRNSIYEFTSSPLTASANTREDQNTYRLEGSWVQERNFGLVEFRGKTFEEREVVMKIMNADGEELYKYIMRLQ